MELKRVVGQDNQSAAAKVAELYGKDALIVSNERVNGNVELIIAVDLDEKDSQLQYFSSEKKPGVDAAMRKKSIGDRGRNFSEIFQERIVEQSIQKSPVSASDGGSESDDEMHESAKAKDLVEMLRIQFAEIREELRSVRNSEGSRSGPKLDDKLQPFLQALRDAGVPGALRTNILNSLSGVHDMPQALASTQTFLMRRVRREKCSQTLNGVHVLIGPSGAGKSTMIGRLAALHANERVYSPEDVAIVSFMDRRPGAWNQIQLIGSQTGVDTFRANDEAQLKGLLEELGGRKLVLIDTTSIGFSDHIRIILSLDSGARLNLLLPADASAATIKRFMAESTNWHSLMISKVDESTQPWPMIQALSESKISISYSAKSPALSGLFAEPSAEILVSLAMRHLAISKDGSNQRQNSNDAIKRASNGVIYS